MLDERAVAAIIDYEENGTGDGANAAVDFMQDRVREHCMSVVLSSEKGLVPSPPRVIDVRCAQGRPIRNNTL